MGMLPRPPSFKDLAEQAVDGDWDSCLELARRAPDKDFDSWFRRWVPADERLECFDRMRDAYSVMLGEKAVDRVKREVEVPRDLEAA